MQLRQRCRVAKRSGPGVVVQHVASEVGVARTTVMKWLQAFDDRGVDGLLGSLPRGRNATAIDPAIVDLVLALADEVDGNGGRLTQREIAVRAGVSQSTVCRLLAKHRRGG